ncbi:TVP38/TMEM64 family protein [Lactiplantibacillus garii]|uniref:TVP38/TMEM64 family protein n=1 Tax=Lactiplantibacillus garii TaxID=2306423 RepID=A0A3R8J5K3_9LACO|nr:VTT domain-containing protein [Lactiplantibacillus garii]RRK09576.1 TVP38/TMEM64 family protein [Lactiplantibacillus garii]
MKLKLSKRQLISTAAVLAVLLVSLLVIRYHGTWEMLRAQVFDQTTIVAQVRRHRAVDILLVVPLLICFSIIPGAPVATVSVVAGICFGKGLGAALNVVGITLGNLIAQRVFNRVTEKQSATKPSKIVDEIANMRHPLLGIVIGYTIPFIPTSLVSLAAVKTGVRSRQLGMATLLGSIPTAVIYACGGDELIKAHFKNALGFAVVVVLLVGLLWLIHRDRRTTAKLERLKK